MSALESAQWFSYACPVCGHRDGADLDIGSARRVGCGHCATVLELSATSSVDERAVAHEFRTTWRRLGDATVGVAEYVTLDLTDIETGDYTLEVVATLPSELDPVRSRRTLTVR